MTWVIASVFGACNDDNDTTYDTTGYTDALVSGFKLPDNDNYAENLSDVYFTINQYGKVLTDNALTGDKLVGEIFNADSLPVGTITKSLLAKITFSSASKVVLYTATDTTDYSETDSINFSKPVLMEVTAANGINKKYYEIKVNVHTQTPDSLQWSSYVEEPLADAGEIVAQKAVRMNATLYWLVSNRAGERYIYTSAAEGDLKQWNKMTCTGLTDADIRSLCAFRGNLYVVTTAGQLLKSSEGASWTAVSTSVTLANLISAYGFDEENSQLIGIIQNGGKYYFGYSLNAADWTTGDELSATFPITGFSNPIEYTSGNASAPFRMLTLIGGKCADGTLTGHAWSYDGVNPWFEYQSSLPALQGATVVAYESDPRTSDTFWMMLGGQLRDESYLTQLYISYNKGISWKKAPTSYAYPQDYKAFAYSSVYVNSNYFINLLGGKNDTGVLNQIWRGRLNQLAFTPVE